MERAHPDEAPHYYLSLLGTHPAQRGKGLGMALLAASASRGPASSSGPTGD